MSETRETYQHGGAAPATAATCPTCGGPAIVVRVGDLPGAQVLDSGSVILPGGGLTHGDNVVVQYHPTPADPLTALEREALEEAIRYVRFHRLIYNTPLVVAVNRVLAARAATGAGT